MLHSPGQRDRLNLRSQQTLTGTRALSGDSRAGFIPTLTLPAYMPGHHWEWRVAVVVARAEGWGAEQV